MYDFDEGSNNIMHLSLTGYKARTWWEWLGATPL
jgi:hypothetical protein